MKKRFRRGLVVGKFAPLHRGHEQVIRPAFQDCEEVVIISYCKPEFAGCDAQRREQWLSKLFPTARILVPTDALFASSQLNGNCFRTVPANDADETTHRRFCGFLCKDVLGITIDAVFTSEDYGEGFARELTRCFREQDSNVPDVQHVLVDRCRKIVPISGTLLRANVHGNRQWLSSEVYGSFVQRVCFLGGESSGKSILAEALAREFETQYVREYGRDLWEAKNGVLKFEDMLHIARRQVAMEEKQRDGQTDFCFAIPRRTQPCSIAAIYSAAPNRSWNVWRIVSTAWWYCVPPIFRSFRMAHASRSHFEHSSMNGTCEIWRLGQDRICWPRGACGSES